MTAKFTNPLDSIKVASPCSADWDAMVGNNRQRHCGECKLDVYNLSGMTKREAENLIMNSEGRVCARFYRRADGTVITKDCPVGWAAVKKRMSTVWTAVASLVFTALGSVGITAYLSQTNQGFTQTSVIAVQPHDEPLMGEVAVDENSNKTFDEQPEMMMGNIAIPEDYQNETMGKIAVSQK